MMRQALARIIATLEGTEGAVVLSSGMAAISSTLLTLLRPGDHLLIQVAPLILHCTYLLLKRASHLFSSAVFQSSAAEPCICPSSLDTMMLCALSACNVWRNQRACARGAHVAGD